MDAKQPIPNHIESFPIVELSLPTSLSIDPGAVVVSIETPLGHEQFALSPRRIALWPRQDMVLLADLHLGKAETFHAHGIPLPDGVLIAELGELASIANDLRPKIIRILGDLFHARIGLLPHVLAHFRTWRDSFPGTVELVPGNHDNGLSSLAADLGISLLPPSVIEHGVCFRHHPNPEPNHMVWCGHEHPAITLGRGFDRVKLPCFAVSRNFAILPAFSKMASGGSRGIPSDARLFAISPDSVFEVVHPSVR